MGGARGLVKVFHASVRGTLTFVSFDGRFLLGFSTTSLLGSLPFYFYAAYCGWLPLVFGQIIIKNPPSGRAA
jgi:hypothetical protein